MKQNQGRTMKAVPPEELKGDRSIDDFIRWVENFSDQTGHFNSEQLCLTFAGLLRECMEAGPAYYDADNVQLLIAFIGTFTNEGNEYFTSVDACKDFARQVETYVEQDEYIGSKPSREKGRGTVRA